MNSRSSAPRYLSTEMRTYVLTNICIRMIIEALYIIAPNWKQPSFLLVGKLIDKLYYSFNQMTIQLKIKQRVKISKIL